MKIGCVSIHDGRLCDRITKRIWHIVDLFLDIFERREEDCVDEARPSHGNAET